MQTALCKKLGIDNPIFAFSHCRDVVAAASNSGGFGVFGATRYTPEQLEVELAWIDDHCGDNPYGVDIVFPETYDRRAEQDDINPYDLVPQGHVDFFRKLLAEEGIPELPEGVEQEVKEKALSVIKTRRTAEQHLEVALRHPKVKLIVNALGAPEAATVDRLHERGVLVGSLVGSPRHAVRQIEAGVDVLVAQGSEAGGHTGSISTLVLVPQVVAVAGDKAAVLAAGGITQGSQVVAMLAVGAQGVWCGTLWLCTPESDVPPAEKAVLLAAKSSETMQVKFKTGKPVRSIASKIGKAMEMPGAPPPLKAPLQQLLFEPFKARLVRASRYDLVGPAAGQGVGMVNDERSVRQIYTDLLTEAADALGRIEDLTT